MPRSSLSALLIGTLLLISPAAALASSNHRHGRVVSRESRLLRLDTQRRHEVNLALSVAESYWGETPCAGEIGVTAALGVPAGMAPDTDAWVTFDSSLGADDLEAPASTYTACKIGLARWQWPTPATISSDWGMFCLTVVHEVGHLLGHPHSTVPGSVMAPVFTNESSVPSICRQRGPR